MPAALAKQLLSPKVTLSTAVSVCFRAGLMSYVSQFAGDIHMPVTRHSARLQTCVLSTCIALVLTDSFRVLADSWRLTWDARNYIKK